MYYKVCIVFFVYALSESREYINKLFHIKIEVVISFRLGPFIHMGEKYPTAKLGRQSENIHHEIYHHSVCVES